THSPVHAAVAGETVVDGRRPSRQLRGSAEPPHRHCPSVRFMFTLHKYPRTRHLEGSRLQPGDEDTTSVGFDELAGRFLGVEEKLDGANAGISFDANGRLWLQSRGHFLTGGSREKHFDLFKRWAHTHADALRSVLGTRYVLYGEWLYAKHTLFYDRLPHYFLEVDVLDAHT